MWIHKLETRCVHKKRREEEWSARSRGHVHHEAGVETLYDVEREKDGSAERQRPRQTRKGNVSIAQILSPPPPTASPRFNMLTLRWIAGGQREKTGDRMAKKKLGRREVKRQKEEYPSDRIAGKGRSRGVEAAVRGWWRAPAGLGIPGTAQTAAPGEKKVCRVTTKDVCYWRSI